MTKMDRLGLALAPLQPMSRAEFWTRLGILQEIDPMVDEAYQFAAELESTKSDRGLGRSHDWHVSFHGSSFPGNNPMACSRQALYKLMDFPRYPVNRLVMQAGEVGKAVEDAVVSRWWRAGMLLSPPPGKPQAEFENKDVWLTATTDAIVLPLKSNKPRVIEVKARYDSEIEDMKRLIGFPRDHDGFVRQLKCEIGMAHEVPPLKVLRCHNTGRLAIKLPDPAWMHTNGEHPDMTICPQHMTGECLEKVTLDPIDFGFLYYVSRDDATRTFEFYFEHDEDFMRDGIAKLADWRQMFLDGALPQTNFDSKRFSHPFGWRWTYPPCQYCDFGEECRVDHKAAVAAGEPIRLADSEGVGMAQTMRADYTYEQARDAVLARWGMLDAA